MKLFGIAFLLIFWGPFGEFYDLSNFFPQTDFQKRLSIERPTTAMCACILPGLFLLCLQPSKRSVGKYLTDFFDFFSFSQKLTYQI